MSASRLLFYVTGALILVLLPVIYGIIYPLFPAYTQFKTGYDIISYIPYFLMFMGLLIAVKIEDSRAFWNTFVFLVIYIVLINFQYFQFGDLQLSDIAQSFSVFLPITIIFITFFSEKKYSVKGLISQFFIVAGVFFLSFILPIHFKTFFDIVFSSHIFINHSHWQLPDYIWFLLIIMISVLYLKINKNTLPLLITLTVLVFLLFQCFNLSAIVNAPTHKVKLYIILLYINMGFFPLYYMLFSYNKKEYFDPLTGLRNEKYLRKVFRKFNSELSLAIIEIDQSELFLDKYGKEEWSNLLRFLSSHLTAESDGEAFRLDDSKFALIYEKTSASDVLWQLNSIREKLSHKKFIIRQHPQKRKISGISERGKLETAPNDTVVTISVGIAHKSDVINTYESLIKEALFALKSAKSKGGNRCIRTEDITY